MKGGVLQERGLKAVFRGRELSRMVRPLRYEVPCAVCHVMARGDGAGTSSDRCRSGRVVGTARWGM